MLEQRTTTMRRWVIRLHYRLDHDFMVLVQGTQ
jgi:hypothetical protein